MKTDGRRSTSYLAEGTWNGIVVVQVDKSADIANCAGSSIANSSSIIHNIGSANWYRISTRWGSDSKVVTGAVPSSSGSTKRQKQCQHGGSQLQDQQHLRAKRAVLCRSSTRWGSDSSKVTWAGPYISDSARHQECWWFQHVNYNNHSGLSGVKQEECDLIRFMSVPVCVLYCKFKYLEMYSLTDWYWPEQ